MIVTRENFHQCLKEIWNHDCIGLDTETSGLHWWKHRLFSVIIRTPDSVYYFNFNWEPDHLGVTAPPTTMLPKAWLKELAPVITQDRAYTIYGSNAKFDMHMLANEGVFLDDVNVVDFHTRERIIRNCLFPFKKAASLDGLARHYLGREKSNTVEEYIQKHKLSQKIPIPGKKKDHVEKRFDAVPFSVVSKYGEVDGDLHYNVGISQAKTLDEVSGLYGASFGYGTLLDVDRNERRLLQTCFRMEREGVLINVDYTQRAKAHEEQEVTRLKKEFRALTGSDYVDSEKCFVPAFERLGLSYPRTPKGNPSFNADALAGITNPVADLITGIRGREKQIGTYYSSFLYFRDSNDKLHASIQQWGTETGRMSYADPNLQNIPKQEDAEDERLPFHVRGCFIPDPDFCLVSIDYSQQEFRMILDYAGEHELIRRINDGYDPHQAVSDETGLSRREAKVFNFGIAYGMGPAALAQMLGVSVEEATRKLSTYFRRMRNVRALIRQVGTTARTRGYIRNWLGRVLKVNDPRHSYVLFNHLIQGGCADVCKIAMNLCDDFLRHMKSKLLLQVHDELVFKIHKTELAIVPDLTNIMSNVYRPRNGMLMPASSAYSWKSWSYWDMEDGFPKEEAA